MLNFLKCMLQLILSPAKGWEDVSHEGRERRELAGGGLYPLTAVLALSCLLAPVYGNSTLTEGIIAAISTAAVYFLTYAIASLLIPLKLPDLIEGEMNEKRTATFILYSIGLMELVWLIGNLLPVDVGAVHFLPIYVAIIMWKGCRYMAVKPGSEFMFMVLVLSAVMLPIYFLDWLFNLVM